MALFFDIEIAKQDHLDPKDYDMLREEIPLIFNLC